ncbi:uncharacterized protein BO66DRAFT_391841 [Aspergillus aculeatinus CBS 121060]|uniref:Uncharacterized protein n=1 Tax=Aspergillus aculeatinus CBS 121060 TaxID=1448322 RepID=A0ACD1H9Q7_9EURO|nr:hypothetical protein BO66DRAFT_391841 [Aspergillus aculeatinus CBS 121060]RAH70331.1 hypothetical protein BO66DRAFT_391841 [Aspergillus aculeatinus CBS 121060]
MTRHAAAAAAVVTGRPGRASPAPADGDKCPRAARSGRAPSQIDDRPPTREAIAVQYSSQRKVGQWMSAGAPAWGLPRERSMYASRHVRISARSIQVSHPFSAERCFSTFAWSPDIGTSVIDNDVPE